MGTLFLEYKIDEASRQPYLTWARDKRLQYGFELMEGTGQPGLFVELWRPVGAEEGAEWRKRRLEPGHPDWSPLHQFVEGGAAKLHIWHFEMIE
ncbi:hypothetical protein [Gorillibacterium sp. sgz5001074]|uniref:hypothetical protein n=1 Tax=Gorillibacterium sp. sgz5001074 TaxID=3446695 RepID=UPI003F67B60D